MDFPASMDPDDLELAKKEWQLGGCQVVYYHGSDDVFTVGEHDNVSTWDWWVDYKLVQGIWKIVDVGGRRDDLPAVSHHEFGWEL